MRKWVGLCMALTLSLLGTSVHSANISDLRGSYEGPAASLTDPNLENTTFGFAVSKRSGTSFFGTISDLEMTISGKVSSSGKISFSGAKDGVLNMQDVDIKLKFKGQLSATGEVAAGTLDLKGTVAGKNAAQKFVVYMTEVGPMVMGTPTGRRGILAR